MKRIALLVLILILCSSAWAATTPSPNNVNGSPNTVAIPSQAGQSGKFLSTNGTALSWTTGGSIPVGTGVVTQNGSTTSITSTVTPSGDLTGTSTTCCSVTGINGNAVSGIVGSGGLVVESNSPVINTLATIGTSSSAYAGTGALAVWGSVAVGTTGVQSGTNPPTNGIYSQGAVAVGTSTNVNSGVLTTNGGVSLLGVTTGAMLCLTATNQIGHCTAAASCTSTCTCTCTAN